MAAASARTRGKGREGDRVESAGEVAGECAHAKAPASIDKRASALIVTKKEAQMLALLIIVAALQVFTLFTLVTVAGRTERLERIVTENKS